MDSKKDSRDKALVLTYCTKRKRTASGRASEVYVGPIRNLFILSERLSARCFVLSAKYGLIECDAHVEPYDLYLGNLSPEEEAKLKERVKGRCEELRGPWEVAVINLSEPYSRLLPCRVEARYALVIGKADVVEAERVLKLVPKTIGRRNSVLKALGRATSLEDVIRLIEEGTLD